MKLLNQVLYVTAGLPGLGVFAVAVAGEGTVRYAVGIGALFMGLAVCSLAVRR